MTARLAVLVLLTIGPAATARAGETADCGKETTQSGLNHCYDQLYRRADAMLNQVYRQLIAKAAAAEQMLLRDAQRAWIAFRDKECEFETIGSEGGSIRPMYEAMCATALTKRRIKELAALRDCKEDFCTLGP